MKSRTLGAIALGPTGNLQSGYKFLNLRTGQIIERREFDKIPMPDYIIKRAKELADNDRQD
eukprot:6037508-Ditylum_brightwellii.AAC.1